MRISDLSYLELIHEETPILGSTATSIGVLGEAVGDYSNVDASIRSSARELPAGGSVSVSIGRVRAVAYDPIDASTTVEVGGTASGDITRTTTQTRSQDWGNLAISAGHVVAVAVDLPFAPD